MMPAYKLIYFNLKGKGETTRLTFHAAGIPFVDQRVEFSEWSALKPKIFTGQLPILEVDGKQLSESTSIARFVAREGGLLGSNSFEQAKIEAVCDAVESFLNTMAKYKYAPEGPIKESMHKDLLEKHIPAAISLLEIFLGDKTYFETDKLSLADIHFFSVFENIPYFLEYNWKEKSPKLEALFERVEKQAKLAAYLKSRA